MRKRSLVMILAMLSILLVGTGTAYAVYGVADHVPAETVVIPIICSVDPAPGMSNINTSVAVAETGLPGNASEVTGCYPPLSDPQITTPDGKLAVQLGRIDIFNSCSEFIDDIPVMWSCYDIIALDCKSLMAGLSTTQRARMLIDVWGKPYYAGYVTVAGLFPAPMVPRDNLIAWAYLLDLGLGFASGFNGLAIENGMGPMMEEDAGAGPITAHTVYPRYFLLNDHPETYNWWIMMLGRNQIGTVYCAGTDGLPRPIVNCSDADVARSVTGIVCNEQEDCHSIGFPVPRELNILDMHTELPASLHAGWPKAGFAKMTIEEQGQQSGVTIDVTGTLNPDACGLPPGEYYTADGLSYQRALGTSVQASWDVTHPMHREYCTSPEGMTYIMGPSCSATP